MKYYISLLPACLFSMHSFTQVLQQPSSSVYTGSGVYSKDFSDAFSFPVNQAALAQLTNTAAGISGENRFLLPGLNNYLMALALITPHGNFGWKAGYAGYTGYKEMQLGLAHGRKLGKALDAGIQFNYSNISIAGYGAASALSFEAGAIFHITRSLNAGVHLNNPVGGRLGNSGEKLPAVYTMGIGYEASELVLVSAEIIKEEEKPVTINAGVYYKFLPQLIAKAGISSASSSIWAGFGFLRKAYRLDLFTSYHLQLGISPGLLLLYNFKSREEK